MAAHRTVLLVRARQLCIESSLPDNYYIPIYTQIIHLLIGTVWLYLFVSYVSSVNERPVRPIADEPEFCLFFPVLLHSRITELGQYHDNKPTTSYSVFTQETFRNKSRPHSYFKWWHMEFFIIYLEVWNFKINLNNINLEVLGTLINNSIWIA